MKNTTGESGQYQPPNPNNYTLCNDVLCELGEGSILCTVAQQETEIDIETKLLVFEEKKLKHKFTESSNCKVNRNTNTISNKSQTIVE